MTSTIHNTEATVSFLDSMFGKDAVHHIVAIAPDGKPIAKSFRHNEREAMSLWIEQRQSQDNMYFSVNRLEDGFVDRKAKKENVVAARYLHVDVDDIGALVQIQTFQPPATAVIFSGGGYQVFWGLKEESYDLEAIENINAAIARKLGGDNCHNIDRIMRLPGTINLPNKKKQAMGRKPVLACVLEQFTDWDRKYTLNDFDGLSQTRNPKFAQMPSGDVRPTFLEDIARPLSSVSRQLIELGDDPENPIQSSKSRFKSRSEAVWCVACDLTRSGYTIVEIAGVLINSAYGISKSILEKASPVAYAIRQAERAFVVVGKEWPDLTRQGDPRGTLRNVIVGLNRLGLVFAHDQFRSRKTVEGHQIQQYQGDLSDDGCAALRHIIIEEFNFDPGKENTREAALTLAIERPFHPIRQYLGALHWDGVERLGNWLIEYLGTEATPLNVAIGRIVLIAAVRRIRHPGVKFDTMVVLEGKQGSGKSTAIRILAGPENFSDQDVLALDPKSQMEALEGVWIYEIAELEGISRADTTKVKAFFSRSEDQARPAYARFKERRPRQVVFIGTTNDDKYLRDMTGNRRFWPVKVGIINLEALARDRDQLWAEAAYYEDAGESIILAEKYWPAAQLEQEARLEDDPWLDKLVAIPDGYIFEINGAQRVSTADLLEHVLYLTTEKQQQYHTKRLAALMRKLGWVGPSTLKFKKGETLRGYERPAIKA